MRKREHGFVDDPFMLTMIVILVVFLATLLIISENEDGTKEEKVVCTQEDLKILPGVEHITFAILTQEVKDGIIKIEDGPTSEQAEAAAQAAEKFHAVVTQACK